MLKNCMKQNKIDKITMLIGKKQPFLEIAVYVLFFLPFYS